MLATATREPPRLAARDRDDAAAFFSRELRAGVRMDGSGRSLEAKVRASFARLSLFGVHLAEEELDQLTREALSVSNGLPAAELDTASLQLARCKRLELCVRPR